MSDVDASYSGDFVAVKQIPSLDGINILLLGSTGVGKSTLINAITNYIKFDSLEDALKFFEVHYVIPTSFKINNSSVKIGQESEHESFKPCQSATQTAKYYSFKFEGKTYNIIDTPGLGDTRGHERDIENFLKIFRCIKENFKELHGIVILMKPNESRATASLTYVINQLFTNLHKNATSNINFILTHSHGTHYKPGDTFQFLETIRDTLQEENGIEIELNLNKNVHCVDNQAFRFLCASKNGVEFDQADVPEYSKAWNKSKEALQNFLTNVSKNKPHFVDETLAMNEAKLIVPILTKIIPQIMNLVQTNKEALEKTLIKIETLTSEEGNLKEKLYIDDFVFIPEHHDWRQITCTKCTDTEINSEGVERKVNKRCGSFYAAVATNAFWGILSLAGLVLTRNPVFIGTGEKAVVCSTCKCGVIFHETTSITYTLKSEKRLNIEIEELLAQKGSEKKAIDKSIKILKEKITQFEMLQEILSKFFTQLMQYLEESSMRQTSNEADHALLKTIKNELGKNNVHMLTPSNIFKMRDELFGLSIVGHDIEIMFNDKLKDKSDFEKHIKENYGA